MSAQAVYIDWRVMRARRALLAASDEIDFDFYALEFDCDVDDAIDIFCVAADELGIGLRIDLTSRPDASQLH
jgi:hypothetical protein